MTAAQSTLVFLYTCIHDQNPKKCDINVFFTIEFCSVIDFVRLGVACQRSLQKLTSHHDRRNVERYFEPDFCLPLLPTIRPNLKFQAPASGN